MASGDAGKILDRIDQLERKIDALTKLLHAIAERLQVPPD